MNKRWIATILAAVMLLTLLGCNSQKPAPTDPSYVPDGTDSHLPSESTGDASEPQPSEDVQPSSEPDGTEDVPDESTSDASEPGESKPDESEPEESKPVESQPEDTKPNETEPGDTTSAYAAEYERYQNMTGAEQKAFMESFDSIEAFFDWYNAAEAAYKELHPDIEVGDGSVDLGGGD